MPGQRQIRMMALMLVQMMLMIAAPVHIFHLFHEYDFIRQDQMVFSSHVR
jgi:hypothetical protein